MKKLFLIVCLGVPWQMQAASQAEMAELYNNLKKDFQNNSQEFFIIAQQLQSFDSMGDAKAHFDVLLKDMQANRGKSLLELLDDAQFDQKKLDAFKEAWRYAHNSSPTLSEGLAYFDAQTYRLFPVSKDSWLHEYNPEVSGAQVTAAARFVATMYALDLVMTLEQQATPVFNCCNDYVRLERAQLAIAGVEATYAGYVYGPAAGAHVGVCTAGTLVGVNALDTFLERHAPQWLDYPDVVKRNAYFHSIARLIVSQTKQAGIGQLVQRAVGAGAAGASKAYVTLWSYGN